jgi:hypothetical protein
MQHPPLHPRLAHLRDDFPNHQAARKSLLAILDGQGVAAYDTAVVDTTRLFWRLAQFHLRAAKQANRRPRAWRAAISRAYYAAYSGSKAVRFYTNGQIAADVEDHKKIGALPNGFPNGQSWGSALVDMRFDRNLADYDAWPDCHRRLRRTAEDNVVEAGRFLSDVQSFFQTRGVIL